MKRLALILGSTSLLSAGAAWAAISCTAAPDCASLGYTSSSGSCTNYVACPFDTSKIACLEKDCTGYTLSSCPTGGSCTSCSNSSGTKYKLDSCNDGYKVSGSTCAAKTCSDYGYSYLGSNVCTTRYSVKLGASTSYCYGGCKACSTLDLSCLSSSQVCDLASCAKKCVDSYTQTVSGYSYGTCTCHRLVTCSTTSSTTMQIQCVVDGCGDDLLANDLL